MKSIESSLPRLFNDIMSSSPLPSKTVVLLLTAMLALPLGCGKPKPAKSTQVLKKTPEKAKPRQTAGNPPNTGKGGSDNSSPEDSPAQPPSRRPPRRSLGDLLEQDPQGSDGQPARVLPAIDEKKVAAAGITKVEGKHLTLYTDVPIEGDIPRLPDLFDRAFPLWCKYFQIDPKEQSQWRMIGSLMKDPQRFKAVGLLPENLPNFRNGYATPGQLWLYDQPSDYYRRHLLLHEGTHAFMYTMLGSCGPPWFMEGTAELLATHFDKNGELTLCHFPRDREEVPMLGRIKLVNQAFARGLAMSIPQIMQYSNRAHLENEPYAWCWALCKFLDTHPQYRERFRAAQKDVKQADFNRRFMERFRKDWQPLNEQWQQFVATLSHGHDIERTAVDFEPGKPLSENRQTLKIAAGGGWQNTGLLLEAGREYQLTAHGRYQVADVPQIWWCEPGGVTIRYYRGRPLGILLGAVRPTEASSKVTPLIRPFTVGLGTTLSPKESGTLYLRINDSPGELDDNAGELMVDVVAK